jgi:hypothetical protein
MVSVALEPIITPIHGTQLDNTAALTWVLHYSLHLSTILVKVSWSNRFCSGQLGYERDSLQAVQHVI